uniref:insulinoma-associated protein 1a-like n=1 Tax=Myxine glutinosa TaxID=7769 RepID=UPI00358DE280
MPKGFLVKRNKKAGAFSYRPRDGTEVPSDNLIRLITTTSTVRCDLAYLAASPQPSAFVLSLPPSEHEPGPQPAPGSPKHGQPALGPAATANVGVATTRSQYVEELGGGTCPFPNLEQVLFTTPPSFHDVTRMVAPGRTQGAKRTSEPSERRGMVAGRRSKVSRRHHVEDNVTTSPVLGLRIKEEAAEGRLRSMNHQLSEYVCQLCQEEYEDPFALAQHRCSRIVRVEYRCPECQKVFSCPANLASHRRWHKPRIPQPQTPIPQSNPVSETETSRPFSPPGMLLPEGHHDSRSEPESSSPASSLSETGSEEGMYECGQCDKRFRRRAYLRKHLHTVHQAGVSIDRGSTFPQPMATNASVQEFACTEGKGEESIFSKNANVQGAVGPLRTHPSVAITQTFREGPKTTPNDLFSCKFCPSTFCSSPGLTRHINKRHPSESRQVVLLQVPVRPAC